MKIKITIQTEKKTKKGSKKYYPNTPDGKKPKTSANRTLDDIHQIQSD